MNEDGKEKDGDFTTPLLVVLLILCLVLGFTSKVVENNKSDRTDSGIQATEWDGKCSECGTAIPEGVDVKDYLYCYSCGKPIPD